MSRGQVGILPTGSHSALLAGPLSGGGHRWVGTWVPRERRGCAPGEVGASALPACSQALGHRAARLTQTGHLRARRRGGAPGAPPDPSLTQADRFLLVFRVCFCLAPFEIGYDVGGKAAASKPRATSAQPQPVLAWKTDGQGAGAGWARCVLLTSVPAFATLSCRGRR